MGAVATPIRRLSSPRRTFAGANHPDSGSSPLALTGTWAGAVKASAESITTQLSKRVTTSFNAAVGVLRPVHSPEKPFLSGGPPGSCARA